jgi:hypothetical protein
LGLPRADVVIAGAGTIVYFRTPDGNLVVDEEFINTIKNQRIVYRHKVDNSFNPSSEENYNPPRLQTYLNKYLGDEFTIKIDQNPAGGFVTLDISKMPYLKLKELIELIKKGVGGIKLEFSEDLEKADNLENHFTGWIQVVPISGGKDKVLRYSLTKICQKINPENRSDKKLKVYPFGDAAIDIWILGMGAGKDHPYILEQIGVANLKPYAKNRLERMKAALYFSNEALNRIRASTQEELEELLLIKKEELRKIITSNSYPSDEKEEKEKKQEKN